MSSNSEQEDPRQLGDPNLLGPETHIPDKDLTPSFPGITTSITPIEAMHKSINMQPMEKVRLFVDHQHGEVIFRPCDKRNAAYGALYLTPELATELSNALRRCALAAATSGDPVVFTVSEDGGLNFAAGGPNRD